MTEFYTPQKPSSTSAAFSEERYTSYTGGIAELVGETGQYNGRAQKAIFALAKSHFPKERWAAIYLFLNSGDRGIIRPETSRMDIATELVSNNWLLPSWSVLVTLPDADHFMRELKRHSTSKAQNKGPTPIFSPIQDEDEEVKEQDDELISTDLVRMCLCVLA